MPFQSEKQRRYIYSRAAAGEEWARKFIRDAGHTPPARRAAKRLAGMLHGADRQ